MSNSFQLSFKNFEKCDNDIDVFIIAQHVITKSKKVIFVANHDDKKLSFKSVDVVNRIH